MIGPVPADDRGAVRTVNTALQLWPHQVRSWEYVDGGLQWKYDPQLSVTGNNNNNMDKLVRSSHCSDPEHMQTCLSSQKLQLLKCYSFSSDFQVVHKLSVKTVQPSPSTSPRPKSTSPLSPTSQQPHIPALRLFSASAPGPGRNEESQDPALRLGR